MCRRKESGFTLIELMIVIAIIGILAAIAIPQFAAYRTKSFNAAAEADLRNAMTAEEAYYATNQKYFAIRVNANPNGYRNANFGINVSKNVALNLATTTTNGADDYTGSSRHSSGDHTYTVTGSVGIIR